MISNLLPAALLFSLYALSRAQSCPQPYPSFYLREPPNGGDPDNPYMYIGFDGAPAIGEGRLITNNRKEVAITFTLRDDCSLATTYGAPAGQTFQGYVDQASTSAFYFGINDYDACGPYSYSSGGSCQIYASYPKILVQFDDNGVASFAAPTSKYQQTVLMKEANYAYLLYLTNGTFAPPGLYPVGSPTYRKRDARKRDVRKRDAYSAEYVTEVTLVKETA